MPESFPLNSVGRVAPQKIAFATPLKLACGAQLNGFELMVETYGKLNRHKSNAILICPALSGDHHAAGYHDGDDSPGWWDHYIGPGKPIDTARFFVIALNNIGGCSGSTGPTSVDPATGQPWGKNFPPLRVRDWVETQRLLADHFEIEKWAAVVGGSLGGMQVMRWSLEYPERVGAAVVIAAALKLTAQNIAFNEIARRAIRSDRDFHDGDYRQHNTLPREGLALARMVGHVTYLSADGLGTKFGRELKAGSFELGSDNPVEFQVESYLNYQGDKFANSFDAHSYLLTTRVLDFFDLAREYGDDPVRAFKFAQCKFLVVSFTTDWRFSPQRSKEIVDALIAAGKQVSYAEIESSHGHDAFLLPNARYEAVLRNYLVRVADDLGIEARKDKPPEKETKGQKGAQIGARTRAGVPPATKPPGSAP